MTILNEPSKFPLNTLALTNCEVNKGSIIEYKNERYVITDIPIIYEGNPIVRLDADLKTNPIRGEQIKIIK